MPNKKWISHTFVDIPRTEDEKNELIRFWDEFYTCLLKNTNISEESDNTKSGQYKDEVFDILHNAKPNLPLSEGELRKIQIDIEDLTMLFDEKSIFNSVPNIIRILIRNNEVSAKDYLRARLQDKDNIELISVFGQYTIEAIIVHVLAILFNIVEYNPIIRVASLVERLESSVRIQALLFKSRRCQKSIATDEVFQVKKSGMERKKRSKLEMMYPIGTYLVQFMEERELITLMNDLSGNVRVKKGSYYLPSHLYAVCNFDISLLPIKLNLPMVCPPQDWTSACPPGEKPRNLSDLSGGYLSGPTGEIYDRYRLLSSGNINHFYIDISRGVITRICVV